MLVLTRKIGEEIRIGPDITIVLVKVKGSTARIGINAPKDMPIVRGELKVDDEFLKTPREEKIAT